MLGFCAGKECAAGLQPRAAVSSPGAAARLCEVVLFSLLKVE